MVWCDYFHTQTECSTSTDGGSHCYANCTPTALRYYGTCNYIRFCNYVALNANYNCVPSYVVLTNGSYSYYVAGIYVNGGIGYMQTGTCQYCTSVAVGGEIDVNCFESEIGGPWTNAQKRNANEEDGEFASNFIKDPSIAIQTSNSAKLTNMKFNSDTQIDRNEKRSDSSIDAEDKNIIIPKSNSLSKIIRRSDDTLEENTDNDSLCNLLGLCDPNWHCRLAGSDLSHPINLSSCCFALINLNLQCACSPIAAALGFYPPPPFGWLGFVCLP